MKDNSLLYSSIFESVMFNFEWTYDHVLGKRTNRALQRSFGTKGNPYSQFWNFKNSPKYKSFRDGIVDLCFYLIGLFCCGELNMFEMNWMWNLCSESTTCSILHLSFPK